MQSQVIEFPWDIIQQYEADDESVSFNFEYTRQGRKPRWVKIYTQYVSMLFDSLCMHTHTHTHTMYVFTLFYHLPVYFNVTVSPIFKETCHLDVNGCCNYYVHVYLQFVYMYDCFERIKTELSWEKEVCDTKILSP